MTSSTVRSGLIRLGSPPSATTASRMAARSTTHGTPVKSCSRTRAGMNEISFSTFPVAFHSASARMSSAFTKASSSRRSRFSSRIFSENGRRDTPANPAFSSAGRLEISTASPPTRMAVRVPKLFNVGITRNFTLPSRPGTGGAIQNAKNAPAVATTRVETPAPSAMPPCSNCSRTSNRRPVWRAAGVRGAPMA